MSFKIPDSIILERDAVAALQQLREAQNSGSSPDTMGTSAQDIASANESIYREQGIEGLIVATQEAVKSSPVVDVILATEPHDLFIDSIGSWFRREIDPGVLLRISVRRGIAGGIIIRSKNRIFDMSFRPRIIAAKGKMSEVLSRV